MASLEHSLALPTVINPACCSAVDGHCLSRPWSSGHTRCTLLTLAIQLARCPGIQVARVLARCSCLLHNSRLDNWQLTRQPHGCCT